MVFDIIDVTDKELNEYTAVQMQLLRNAQKKKNELQHALAEDKAIFRKIALTNGMKDSSIIAQRDLELETEYYYQLEIVVEQLLYSLQLNAPLPDSGEGEEAGYIVDYNLSYTDRYIIVRDYYLAIADTGTRMSLYTNDDVAKRYLGSYYTTLYNVLYTYSQ